MTRPFWLARIIGWQWPTINGRRLHWWWDSVLWHWIYRTWWKLK